MNRTNPCNPKFCPPMVNTSHPLAMAYVPKQHYHQMFDLYKGLQMGTIFPELCLPFCGVRGKCACKTVK